VPRGTFSEASEPCSRKGAPSPTKKSQKKVIAKEGFLVRETQARSPDRRWQGEKKSPWEGGARKAMNTYSPLPEGRNRKGKGEGKVERPKAETTVILRRKDLTPRQGRKLGNRKKVGGGGA